MKKKTNKKITIDVLARMIGGGFNGVGERLNVIDRKLDKHAAMLVDHTERLKRIETKLEGVIYRREYEELEVRVKTLERVFGKN